MNEIIKAFFTSGYDTNVQQCVMDFLETILMAIDKIEEENLVLAYMIDDINNTTYHVEAIKQLCVIIKQQQLMKILTARNNAPRKEQEKEQEKEQSPYKHLKFFDKYNEHSFIQARFTR